MPTEREQVLEDLGLSAETAEEHPDEGDEKDDADHREEDPAEENDSSPADPSRVAPRSRRGQNRSASLLFGDGHVSRPTLRAHPGIRRLAGQTILAVSDPDPIQGPPCLPAISRSTTG